MNYNRSHIFRESKMRSAFETVKSKIAEIYYVAAGWAVGAVKAVPKGAKTSVVSVKDHFVNIPSRILSINLKRDKKNLLNILAVFEVLIFFVLLYYAVMIIYESNNYLFKKIFPVWRTRGPTGEYILRDI
ncbi:hypothetical protein NEMIN01_0379 [Nematocida minor]|uniref:uncharacterized protein n=1 Tax=Nematocida minor TaxID=1912983 RepID=UPI00221F2348|nr:uncharacterized protein NEMIN01_0379 [Nematocida minor]KAI5189213.1 hypothetical protein NEMIN01_0379 [Nematocida minor]